MRILTTGAGGAAAVSVWKSLSAEHELHMAEASRDATEVPPQSDGSVVGFNRRPMHPMGPSVYQSYGAMASHGAVF